MINLLRTMGLIKNKNINKIYNNNVNDFRKTEKPVSQDILKTYQEKISLTPSYSRTMPVFMTQEERDDQHHMFCMQIYKFSTTEACLRKCLRSVHTM